MSLTQDHGDFVFQCDGNACHENLETVTSNFASAQNVLHRHHWKANKQGQEWKHFCPECQQGSLL